MNKVLAAALSLPLIACVVGDSGSTTGNPGGDPGTGSDMGSDPGNPGGTGTGISGHITSDTTWSDTVTISGNVTIDAGVTVTVAAGATVKVAGTAGINVLGTLNVAGTAASHATITPDTGTNFQAISVGGTVTATFASINGAEIQLSGGSFTASDSKLWGAPGDLLVMNGGTINVTYSNIGDATSDTTHCNMHFGGTTPNTITIEHNNITSRPYGLMFYSGTNADFKNNNWTNQIDIEPGVSGVTGDASGSYFAKGQPAGTTGITYGTLAPAALTDAGPRG
jgi:hypothetical protein